MKELFKEIPNHLESCRKKKSLVKSGRWFSWMTACDEHLSEWFALKMLLKHGFPEATDPDDITEKDGKSFNELRSDSGGLKLGLRCLTFKNWLTVNCLYLGGKPLWSWWAKTIKDIKNPSDGLRNFVNMSHQWRSDQQLRDLVSCLRDWKEFDRVQKYCSLLHQSMDSFVEELWYYITGLLFHRVETLTKHEAPPYCYAPVFSDDEVVVNASFEMLQSDWKILCVMEQSGVSICQDLAVEMRGTVYAPMRLAYLLLETCDRQGALEILRGMLHVFPDTKLIEDCHQKVRCEALENPNRKLTTPEVQAIVVNSRTLESRGVSHTCALTKDAFMRKWKKRKGTKWQSKYHAANEKLPLFFSKIMGKKQWPTLSEESLTRSAGAWAWARHYNVVALKQSGIALKDFGQKILNEMFIFIIHNCFLV